MKEKEILAEKKKRSAGCAAGACGPPYAPRFLSSDRRFCCKFTTMSKFPEVQGGGSLILAWQVKSKNVVVIGGGEVS